MFQRIASFLGFVLFALLAPCLAQAQDDNYAGKFGGWYLSADFLAGMAPHYPLFGNRSDDTDDYAMHYSRKYQSIQKYQLDESQDFSFAVQIQGGYLFGSRIFVGPELSASLGLLFATIDGRVRLVAPLYGGHALDLSVGLGAFFGNALSGLYDGKESAAERLFIPIQLGYNYTFDSGFMLGLSFQMNIEFADEEQYYHYREDHWDGYWKEKNSTMAFVGFWGLGVRLGYRFGHKE